MEVESIQSVSLTSVESNEIPKIDVSEEVIELLKLTMETMVDQGWLVIPQKPNQVVRTIEKNMIKLYRYVENSSDVRPDDDTVLAQVYFQMSAFYHNLHSKKEKLYIGDAYLTRCLKLLKDKKFDRKGVLIAMSAYFELSCLWQKLENFEKSEKYINELFELYKLYTQEKDDYPIPVCILTAIGQQTGYRLIQLDEIYWKALGSISLNKLQKEKIKDEDILFCMHKLLKKYLKIVPSVMGRAEWTNHAIFLSRLLLTSNRFTEAQNHIAAAAFMIKEFYDKEYTKMDITISPEEHNAITMQYIREICKVNICWAWYGIMLLSLPEEQFRVNRVENEPREASDLQLASRRSVIQTTQLQFTDFGKDLKDFIALSNNTYVMNYIDAEAVFHAVLHRLDEVSIYVRKSNSLELYIDLIRCTSKVYKYLAHHERYKCNQIELHKKRIAALNNVKKLFYAMDDEYLNGYISLELAIATSTLLEIQFENLPMNVDPMSSLEIKESIKTSMQNLQLCIPYFH